MSKAVKRQSATRKPAALFDRVVSILEQARGNVVRAVNTSMVLAYWLIGREIVEEIQRGKGRAEYGEKVIEDLSVRLTERYGQGFSEQSLQNFRRFYLTYPERIGISSPMGRESPADSISSPVGRESVGSVIPHPPGVESEAKQISYPRGTELELAQKATQMGSESLQGFSPQLSWSHYRALMRVENREARGFYEREAVAGGTASCIVFRRAELLRKASSPLGRIPSASCSAPDG